MRYRPEIDGLRAAAVIAVILYHADVPAFARGYLGVDIFFVISGYLITGFLIGDLTAGSLSIAGFYERRIRRIIPALVVVMAICVPIALFMMIPNSLENFGQSLTATALFANNILLFLTSGYFEIQAAFKPLMHTWTLAVEEQFYIVAPLVLYLAFRYGGERAAFWTVATLTLASLAFSAWASTAMPRADFLLLPSRAWELGGGATAYLAKDRLRRVAPGRAAAVLSFIGLTLLAISVIGFTHIDDPSPAIEAPAVIGTALLLLYANEGTGVGRVLALKPIVAVGLISYSLYLYHQPVFAFVRVASLEQPSSAELLAFTPLIFALAWLSWRYIEVPFRNRQKITFYKTARLFGAASLALAALGVVLHLTSGFYYRSPEVQSDGTLFGTRQNIAFNLRPVSYLHRAFGPKTSGVKVVVVGNSFGRDFINMAVESGNATGLDISLWDESPCYPEDFPPAMIQSIGEADFIVVATSEPFAGCPLPRFHEVIAHSHAQTIVVGTKNFGWSNDAVMLRPASERYHLRVKPLNDVAAVNDAWANALPSSVYVNVLAMLSDADGRVPVFTPERKFISEDGNHLTRAGAAYVGAVIFRHPGLHRMAASGQAASVQARGTGNHA